LFAAVLLAPRFEQQEQLTVRVLQLAGQCRYLQEMNAHLDRVSEAIEHDASFTAEMARYELDYSLPGEQRLPAPVREWRRPERPAPPPSRLQGWAPLIRLFAQDKPVRQAALLTAAVFAIVSLSLFTPPNAKTS
jgi:hypothetical protein